MEEERQNRLKWLFIKINLKVEKRMKEILCKWAGKEPPKKLKNFRKLKQGHKVHHIKRKISPESILVRNTFMMLFFSNWKKKCVALKNAYTGGYNAKRANVAKFKRKLFMVYMSYKKRVFHEFIEIAKELPARGKLRGGKRKLTVPIFFHKAIGCDLSKYNFDNIIEVFKKIQFT